MRAKACNALPLKRKQVARELVCEQSMMPLVFLGLQPTLMVVQASMTVADVKEFIALARANPGKFNYGNSSTGSARHFAFNMLKLLTGIDVVEVPFAGSAPYNLAFAQGEVHTIMGSLLSISPNLQTGKPKPLGVAFAERMEGFPNVPTFREQGIPVEWDTFAMQMGIATQCRSSSTPCAAIASMSGLGSKRLP